MPDYDSDNATGDASSGKEVESNHHERVVAGYSQG